MHSSDMASSSTDPLVTQHQDHSHGDPQGAWCDHAHSCSHQQQEEQDADVVEQQALGK